MLIHCSPENENHSDYVIELAGENSRVLLSFDTEEKNVSWSFVNKQMDQDCGYGYFSKQLVEIIRDKLNKILE